MTTTKRRLSKGDRVEVGCKPWGDERVEISMPCCDARVTRELRVCFTHHPDIPNGGFTDCPGCGWRYRILTPTKGAEVPASVELQV